MARGQSGKPMYHVGTGGGPGMMQAANEGAYVAGGKSIGFVISLPFESGLNPYVSEELAFQFHYFFTRKFWMAYKIMGLVVAPGGLGTLDEMFELITLKQTGRIKKPIPVILFGQSYWDSVFNFQAMADYGMISQNDVDGVLKTDSVDEALEYLIACVEEFDHEGWGQPAAFLDPRVGMSPNQNARAAPSGNMEEASLNNTGFSMQMSTSSNPKGAGKKGPASESII